MQEELSLKEMQREWHGTYRSYAMGFIFSLLLTSASFYLVAAQVFSKHVLMSTIVTFGMFQAILQLRFFLHVGQEHKPRWETLIFYFMVSILLIVALGTLWIMTDLEYRAMVHMMEEAK